MEQKFKAKRDWYITLLVALITCMVGAFCYFMLFKFKIGFINIFCVIIFIIALILFYTFYFSCYYIINDTKLIIKIGFINFDVNLKSIKEINLVKNFKLSFALSKHRVQIKLSDKNKKWSSIYVSPKNIQEFYNVLKQLCIKY